MAGHVFIVRGDLRKLACDAFLISCSRGARPGNEWFLPGYDGPRRGERFTEGGPRVQPLQGAAPDRPRPWLAHVGAGSKSVSWYGDGAMEFLEAAAGALVESGTPPLFGRAKSLLALPIVGTGLGGAAAKAGEVVQELLPRLEEFARRTFPGDRSFDVALVCWDASNHAAAQAERVRRGTWPTDLTPDLRKEAERLARLALGGELALFLGAGLSMAAGLPSWAGLLDVLAVQAGLSDEERQALAELRSALDQATLIERRLREQGQSIGAATAAVLERRRHYALAHSLLAALPVREVITTNYDVLFEEAWRQSDPEGLTVLPGQFRPNTRRWLLKMHGSRPRRRLVTAHLLVGDRFNTLLSPGERLLRDALARFVSDVTAPDAAGVRATVAWPRIERMLRGLGFDPPV